MRPHAYIDGTCEIPLPAGPIRVELHKGPEYNAQHLEPTLSPGKLALRFTLGRWADLRQDGWYSGDTRVHFLSPHAALLEAAAEDVAVVNLLATECDIPGPFGRTYPAIPNLLAFSGQQPVLETAGHMVVVNTHNSHPVLGSLGLLNCHRVVFPLRFGGPQGSDDWTLADWCDQCHRKGGLVVWSKTWHESQDFAQGEPLADLFLGKVDAYEIDYFEDSPFDVLSDWYALLHCGHRLPLVGASGKNSNGIALGTMRTYARLRPDEPFVYRNWIEAIRAGRTFVSNGPLLSLAVDGQGPGAVLDVSSPSQRHQIRAEARAHSPFDRLEIVANGGVVASASASGSPCGAVVEGELALPEGGWLAARCQGEYQILHRPANQRIFAHTSPVYVCMAGQRVNADQAVVARLVRRLDAMLEWVGHEARSPDEQQRERLANVFRAAKAELLKRQAG